MLPALTTSTDGMNEVLKQFVDTDIEVLIAAGNDTNNAYMNLTGLNSPRPETLYLAWLVPPVRMSLRFPWPPWTMTARIAVFHCERPGDRLL